MNIKVEEGAEIISKLLSVIHQFPSSAEDLLGEKLYNSAQNFVEENLPEPLTEEE